MFKLYEVDYNNNETFINEYNSEEECYKAGYEYKDMWMDDESQLFIYKGEEVYAMV